MVCRIFILLVSNLLLSCSTLSYAHTPTWKINDYINNNCMLKENYDKFQFTTNTIIYLLNHEEVKILYGDFLNSPDRNNENSMKYLLLEIYIQENEIIPKLILTKNISKINLLIQGEQVYFKPFYHPTFFTEGYLPPERVRSYTEEEPSGFIKVLFKKYFKKYYLYEVINSENCNFKLKFQFNHEIKTFSISLKDIFYKRKLCYCD